MNAHLLLESDEELLELYFFLKSEIEFYTTFNLLKVRTLLSWRISRAVFAALPSRTSASHRLAACGRAISSICLNASFSASSNAKCGEHGKLRFCTDAADGLSDDSSGKPSENTP